MPTPALASLPKSSGTLPTQQAVLHKATPSIPRKLALLANSYKHTQKVKQNETEKYIPNTRKKEKPKEKKTSNLPDKEFKVMVIKMLTKYRRKMEEHSENFNKEKENIKKEPIRAEE